MWLSRSRFRTLEETVLALEKAADDLATCCSNNAENWTKTNSAFSAVKADVDLQWEKVNRALSRLAKRDAIEATPTNGEDGALDLNEKIRRGMPI